MHSGGKGWLAALVVAAAMADPMLERYPFRPANKGPGEPHPDDFNHPDQKAKRAAKKAARKAKAQEKGDQP